MLPAGRGRRSLVAGRLRWSVGCDDFETMDLDSFSPTLVARGAILGWLERLRCPGKSVKAN